ncbi:MAG: hypothetical protein ABSD41_03285 [Candidatus Bathyarchaeia archaeon]|jgi:hypothetical protein
MANVRLYRITIASVWYDSTAGGAKEYELHLKVARAGNVRTVRRTLAKRGAPYFQQLVYRRLKRWIPMRKIKVRFEQEEPAIKRENKISIDGRSMLYRGKRWKAYPLGKWELNYAKRRRS